jgi:ribosome biogenesis protein UTP30
LADDRIVNRLPAVLGKTFFKNTTKRPIPVIISANPNSKKPAEKTAGKKQPKTEDERATSIGTHEQVAREIERALGAALVTLNPSPQICVKVGHANMSPEDLAENLNALALAVVDKHVPQKWKNVKGVFVKGPETAALPIWQTDALWLEGKDVVKGEEGKKAEGDSKKRKARGDDEEEASAEGSPMPKKARKAGGAPAAVEAPSAASPLKAKKNNKGVKAKPKGRKVPDSNDGQLDKQISDRKAKLRQQKRAARAADDD